MIQLDRAGRSEYSRPWTGEACLRRARGLALKADTRRAGPPRSEMLRCVRCCHVVHHAETLRRLPLVQLPGPPSRPRGGRAAQGRGAGAVPGGMGAGSRPGVPAGAGRGAAREQDLRGVPRAERPGAMAEAGAPGRHRQAGARRGVPRHPGAAPRRRAAPAGGRGPPGIPHQRLVGRVPQDARRRAGLPEPGVGDHGDQAPASRTRRGTRGSARIAAWRRSDPTTRSSSSAART